MANKANSTAEKLATPAKAPRTSRAVSEIDFDSPADFDFGASTRQTSWSKKIDELVAGVAAGKGKVGKFYLVGEFGNASGARTVVRGFEDHPERLTSAVGLQTRVITKDGARVSELWACVPAVETVDEDGYADIDPD